MSDVAATPATMTIAHRRDNWIVLAFGVLMLMLMAQFLFFLHPYGDFDELGLYNMPYTHLHTGQMTYPAHWSYDSAIVHPPTHYWQIAMLLRLGLETHIAFYLPTFLLFALASYLIWTSPFSSFVKLGFLFGMYAAAFFSPPSLRPDMIVMVAWMAGLIALESARLESWNTRKLLLGSALITYASMLHYTATFAFLGVFVYSTWILWKFGWRAGRRKWCSLALGACLMGVPYLAFFIIPHFRAIRSHTAGVAPLDFWGAFEKHQALYGLLFAETNSFPPGILALLGPIWKMGIPIPLFLWLLLLVSKFTRGIALASVPLLLFILFWSPRKFPMYLMPETALYLAALTSVIGLGIFWAVKRFAHPARNFVLPICACLLGAVCVYGNPVVSNMDFRPTARRHVMHVARACNRELLGENAVVGIRICNWYTAGGDHARDFYLDIIAKNCDEDVDRYFEMFDGLVELPHLRESVSCNDEGDSLASWYLKGRLHLRGFFITSIAARSNSSLTFASPRISSRTQGFLQWNDEHVWRFEQQEGGDHMLVVVVAPHDWRKSTTDSLTIALTPHSPPEPELFPAHRIDLPSPNAPQDWTASTQSLWVTAVATSNYDDFLKSLKDNARVHEAIAGTLQRQNTDDLYVKLRRTDKAIRIYRSVENLGIGIQARGIGSTLRR